MPSPKKSLMLTDAFGAVILPGEVIQGLQQHLPYAHELHIFDDTMTLRVATKALDDIAVARAITWLRNIFSPFIPCSAETLTKSTHRTRRQIIHDHRTIPLQTITISELRGSMIEPSKAINEVLEAVLSKTKKKNKKLPSSNPVSVENDATTEWIDLIQKFLPMYNLSIKQISFSCLKSSPNNESCEVIAVQPIKKTGTIVHFLLWHDLQPSQCSTFLAATTHQGALEWLIQELKDAVPLHPGTYRVLLDGLEHGVARRPMIAERERTKNTIPVLTDNSRCSQCGLCAGMCPQNCLSSSGKFIPKKVRSCLSCYSCIEACPLDAKRPAYSPRSMMLSSMIQRRPGWLSRLRGAAGPAIPAASPPSFLLPKKGHSGYTLGLSIVTMQEHAAVLFKDGKIIGAVEEEKLSRIRHYGWRSKTLPGSCLSSDPTLCFEEVLCRRSIRYLLEKAGITIDDIDMFAINGIPARYRHIFSPLHSRPPIPLLRSGRIVCVPHHLCHAASAYRVSGLKKALIATVDGRGDRETAALFIGKGHSITPHAELLSLNDSSIGGVYETITRIVGFGDHGQGSTMALAAFGKPVIPLNNFLSLQDRKRYSIHEQGISTFFGRLQRNYSDTLSPAHKDLAASLQHALESTMLRFLEDDRASAAQGLCLAGGVALNCQMNEFIKQQFQPEHMFVQPAANDAGTALGAGLEALHHYENIHPTLTFDHAYLGPAFSDDDIEAALEHANISYRRSSDIAQETAALLGQNNVVCWSQGQLEFGPRALGARSILADPRQLSMKQRVNRMKEREAWRPFGPSILAGQEKKWFTDPFESRFMLFALPVKNDMAAQIPAVMHQDGTTRPNTVHEKSLPQYYRLLEHFQELTSIPMLLNTSFNRRNEPMVCTPYDAINSFIGLKADALAIGSFIVEASQQGTTSPEPDDPQTLSKLPGSRRLMLRLTTHCSFNCPHCPLLDIPAQHDRTLEQAITSLQKGRKAHCDELVIMRGEALERPELPDILKAAKAMGYRYVQVQTNAYALGSSSHSTRFLNSEIDAFEITLLAAEKDLHEELTGTQGTFEQTMNGIKNALSSNKQVLITIPTLEQNREQLGQIVDLVHALGGCHIQFNFPRPVETTTGLTEGSLHRLSIVSPYIRLAAARAHRYGMNVSFEKVPFCHRDQDLCSAPQDDPGKVRIDDLHILHPKLKRTPPYKKHQAPCGSCRYNEPCPKVWDLYFLIYGSSELHPIKKR